MLKTIEILISESNGINMKPNNKHFCYRNHKYLHQ